MHCSLWVLRSYVAPTYQSVSITGGGITCVLSDALESLTAVDGKIPKIPTNSRQSVHEDKCSLTLYYCTRCRGCCSWTTTAGMGPQALGDLASYTFHAQVMFLVLTRGDFLAFIIFIHFTEEEHEEEEPVSREWPQWHGIGVANE